MAARRTTTRETKMSSRMQTETTEEQKPKKSGGLSMLDGLAIVTTLLMIGAILLVDYNLAQMDPNSAVLPFFKK
jgi:hypothetical protein